MKKLGIMALAAFAFAGCGNDDDASPVNPTNGVYKLTSATSSRAYDGNEDGNESTNIMVEAAGCIEQSTLTLGADNVASHAFFYPFGSACLDIMANGTYVESGNNLTVSLNTEEGAENFSFTRDGSALRATIQDFIEIEVLINGEIFYESVDAEVVYTRQ